MAEAKKDKSLEQEIEDRIVWGRSNIEIFNALKNTQHVKDFPCEDALRDYVFQLCHDYPSYEWIQKVMRSKIILDMATQEHYLFDIIKKEQVKTTWDTIRKAFHPKMNLNKKLYVCLFDYNPIDYEILKPTDKGYHIFNTYKAPDWFEDVVYRNNKLEPVTQIPEMYEKFLKHLVNGHEGSYNYILDWLSHAIRDRNRCALVTIGKPGIGKGILGGIMKGLVGEENFFWGADKMFKERFNPQLSNKRIVYCDEFKIKTRADEDSLKLMANDTIEVEKKGVDAAEIKNYASLYMSSNHLDSLRIPADDRRFSVVELTKEKIVHTWSEHAINDLFDPANIDKFARFLYFRDYNRSRMLLPFKTKYSEEIRAAALFEWQEWFLDDYCIDNAGKTVSMKQVREDIGEEFGYNKAPGSPKFQRLEEDYPNKFHLYRKREGNKRPYFIEFKTIEEQKKGS